MDKLVPSDFYLRQNREIFETIYTMFNFSQTIDPVTVLDKLKELGYYHDNSRDYILHGHQTHDQLLPGHFQVEKCHRLIVLFRHIQAEIQ